MADLSELGGFNADEVEPNKGFDPLPAGDYTAVIEESEYKPNAGGTGKYLKLQFQVVEGPYSKRKLFANLNIVHQNEQAQQIARGDFSAICRAVGVPKPTDSSELHNKSLVLKVGLDKRKDTGELANVIRGYKPAGENAAVKTQAQASGNAPPWKKG